MEMIFKTDALMKKRFLFINLSINSGWNTGMNHGIAALVPIIKKHSFEVACLNLRSELNPDEFMKKILDFDPGIIGYSLTSHQMKYLIKYSELITETTKILQIAGGTGPSVDPQGVLAGSHISGVCVGDGEVPIDNLLKNIESAENIFNTEGFCWSGDGMTIKNKIPQFISDLSTLDFPDYSVFDGRTVVREGALDVILSRGCPYNCSYCCNHTIKNIYSLYSSSYYRLPPVEYCIRFLEMMITRYRNIRFIAFADDIMIANREWFTHFASEYRKRIKISYKACARVEYIRPEIVQLLKSSGCRYVAIGIESGNESLRRSLLNRKHSNDFILEKCRIIKQSGLLLRVFNIVGFPFESRREMKETYELNRRISPDGGHCFFFYPYKGTRLYTICKKYDLLKPENEYQEITNYNTKPSIKMSSEQREACIFYQNKLEKYLESQSPGTD